MFGTSTAALGGNMRFVSGCVLFAVLASSSPVLSQPACITGELFKDNGFEDGLGESSGRGFGGDVGPWHWSTTDGLLSPFFHDQDVPGLCHAGSWCIRFSQLLNVSQTLSQAATIPPDASVNLTFW